MSEFLHDPRRVMAAAYNCLTKRPRSGLDATVREAQIRLLASGIAAMDRMSPELSTLHHVYRMALVVIGKDERWAEENAQRRLLYRLERAYGLA